MSTIRLVAGRVVTSLSRRVSTVCSEPVLSGPTRTLLTSAATQSSDGKRQHRSTRRVQALRIVDRQQLWRIGLGRLDDGERASGDHTMKGFGAATTVAQQDTVQRQPLKSRQSVDGVGVDAGLLDAVRTERGLLDAGVAGRHEPGRPIRGRRHQLLDGARFRPLHQSPLHAAIIPSQHVGAAVANTWRGKTGARHRQLEQKQRMFIFWQAMTG
jgi:hypothetical protein